MKSKPITIYQTEHGPREVVTNRGSQHGFAWGGIGFGSGLVTVSMLRSEVDAERDVPRTVFKADDSARPVLLTDLGTDAYADVLTERVRAYSAIGLKVRLDKCVMMLPQSYTPHAEVAQRISALALPAGCAFSWQQPICPSCEQHPGAAPAHAAGRRPRASVQRQLYRRSAPGQSCMGPGVRRSLVTVALHPPTCTSRRPADHG